MIYDCFTFFNELDLLEIRLNILNDVVDKFVLVEATKTFSGKDKPLYYEQNKKRFAKFQDKIIHVIVDDFPKPDDKTQDVAFMMESYQRNAILWGLKSAKDNDVVIIADLDEIPNPETVYEGAKKEIFVNSYERSREARDKCIAARGCKCSVCGMDFEKTYGELGKGFIHVHHIVPISTIGDEYKIDPVKFGGLLLAVIHKLAEIAVFVILFDEVGAEHHTFGTDERIRGDPGEQSHILSGRSSAKGAAYIVII